MQEDLLRKELESQSDSQLISLVKNNQEEGIDRVQLAWEVLEVRGLSEALLLEMQKEDEKAKFSLSELADEKTFTDSNNDFSTKIEKNVGTQIFGSYRDVMGVYKKPSAQEHELPKPNLTESEKEVLVRKFSVRLIISFASFAFALVLFAIDVSFRGKALIELGFIIHSLLHLFLAFSIYRIMKSA